MALENGTQRRSGWLVGGVAVLVVAAYFVASWLNRPSPQVETSPPGSSGSGGGGWTIPGDGGTMILVRHTGDVEVAQACVRFAERGVGKRWQVEKLANVLAPGSRARFLVNPAYRNCVELDGPMEWDTGIESNMVAMAEFLSKDLRTRVVVALVGPQAASGVLGIYEEGTRRFWCRRGTSSRPGDSSADVRPEDVAWARQQGFDLGPAGFAQFGMREANALVAHLGMDLSEAPPPESCLVLNELD